MGEAPGYLDATAPRHQSPKKKKNKLSACRGEGRGQCGRAAAARALCACCAAGYAKDCTGFICCCLLLEDLLLPPTGGLAAAST
jgi:hypothetical protein